MFDATRRGYIVRLAVLIALGSDDETSSDEEYTEACAFLESAGIAIPATVSLTAPEIVIAAGASV